MRGEEGGKQPAGSRMGRGKGMIMTETLAENIMNYIFDMLKVIYEL